MATKTKAGVAPGKVKGWSKRILAVKTELDQVSPGTDVQLAQTRRSMAAQLEAIQTEMDAAAEKAE